MKLDIKKIIAEIKSETIEEVQPTTLQNPWNQTKTSYSTLGMTAPKLPPQPGPAATATVKTADGNTVTVNSPNGAIGDAKSVAKAAGAGASKMGGTTPPAVGTVGNTGTQPAPITPVPSHTPAPNPNSQVMQQWNQGKDQGLGKSHSALGMTAPSIKSAPQVAQPAPQVAPPAPTPVPIQPAHTVQPTPTPLQASHVQTPGTPGTPNIQYPTAAPAEHAVQGANDAAMTGAQHFGKSIQTGIEKIAEPIGTGAMKTAELFGNAVEHPGAAVGGALGGLAAMGLINRLRNRRAGG